MKKNLFVSLLVMLTIMLSMSSCSRAKCDAGFECVYVMKPVIFGSGGVAENH